MDFSLTFNTRNKYKTKYVINQLNTMTKSNLNRNCTSFVSCFITYKFQPNIVKYSNVRLLIKWWQLYKTINLVSIWEKNDFLKNISRTTAKIWCFSRTIPEPKKLKNNSRNLRHSRTSGHPAKLSKSNEQRHCHQIRGCFRW